jgi:hypothetical protein
MAAHFLDFEPGEFIQGLLGAADRLPNRIFNSLAGDADNFDLFIDSALSVGPDLPPCKRLMS